MPFAAPKVVGDPGSLLHLARGQDAARYFGADHMNAWLALRIDTAPQPLRPELIVRDLARHPFLRMGPEQLDVGPNRGIVFSFRPRLELGFGNAQHFRGGHGHLALSL